MANDIRLTGAVLKIVSRFLANPREALSGSDLFRELRIGAGTLYPVLARLETAQWLKSEWEDIDPAVEGRPRRRFYRLTAMGQARAREALQPLQIPSGDLAWNM